MITVINDNAMCMDFLRKNAPELIEHMPTLGAVPLDDKTTIVRQRLYNPQRKEGAAVLFYGAGAPTADSGWSIIMFPAENDKESETRYHSILELLDKAVVE